MKHLFRSSKLNGRDPWGIVAKANDVQRVGDGGERDHGIPNEC